MYKCTCPYCGEEMEDPDECYEPDVTYEQECPHCEKLKSRSTHRKSLTERSKRMNETYCTDTPMDAPVKSQSMYGTTPGRPLKTPSTVETCLERATKLRRYAEELQIRMIDKLGPVLLPESGMHEATKKDIEEPTKPPKAPVFNELDNLFAATRHQLRAISEILDRVDL